MAMGCPPLRGSIIPHQSVAYPPSAAGGGVQQAGSGGIQRLRRATHKSLSTHGGGTVPPTVFTHQSSTDSSESWESGNYGWYSIITDINFRTLSLTFKTLIHRYTRYMKLWQQ